MILRKELKGKAKEQLKGRWVLAILTVCIYALILGIPSLIVSNYASTDRVTLQVTFNLITMLLAGVLTLGLVKFLLNFVTRKEEAQCADLFSGFNIYLKTLGLYVIIGLIVFVGTFLFVIPGIIASLMLSQSFFILSEDNSKSIRECIKESINMMVGHKWELFLLEVSFLGWAILSVLTFGIGFIWLFPYIYVTETNFYLQLKDEKQI